MCKVSRESWTSACDPVAGIRPVHDAPAGADASASKDAWPNNNSKEDIARRTVKRPS
jgi:hypothetical protein